MLNKTVIKLTEKSLAQEPLTLTEAEQLLSVPATDLWYGANRIREQFRKNQVNFCSIINAKSGHCSEDCHFCAQSAHYKTTGTAFPLQDKETIVAGARSARANKAACFSLVTSGKGICRDEDLDQITEAITAVNKEIDCCASLGELTVERATRLRASGLTRYHHNIETSEAFFPNICSTHTYADKIKTIKIAQDAGFTVCSGGIFGLGESWDDRLAMAFTLRDLGVGSVPLNFLVPIAGTPLEKQKPLPLTDILRIVALFRFIMPKQDIKVSGGREKNLRNYQSWIFYAGANGFLIGNYLTTAGQSVEEDLQMVADLGFIPETRNDHDSLQ